jgi:hypothetical protein
MHTPPPSPTRNFVGVYFSFCTYFKLFWHMAAGEKLYFLEKQGGTNDHFGEARGCGKQNEYD